MWCPLCSAATVLADIRAEHARVRPAGRRRSGPHCWWRRAPSSCTSRLTHERRADDRGMDARARSGSSRTAVGQGLAMASRSPSGRIPYRSPRLWWRGLRWKLRERGASPPRQRCPASHWRCARGPRHRLAERAALRIAGDLGYGATRICIRSAVCLRTSAIDEVDLGVGDAGGRARGAVFHRAMNVSPSRIPFRGC